ncbi:hypothetical protein ACRRTK_016976 [Alexandromys fortis]
MSGVQSKAARLQKEHKEKFLADTEREMASSEDLKYNHVSAAMMKKFNALMEMQDMMFVEMRESLKNDLKEMLVKHTPPEAKSLEESAQQEGNESASEKVEEGSSETDEDTENLTVKSEEKSKLSKKQDKKLDSSRDVKPSPERMGEARHHVDEGCRESRGRADGKTLGDTKREAGRIASDSLSFLFINEVNVASPNVKTSEEETLEQKDKETLELERQEVSRLEEGEVPEIEGEESSEEEASDTEDEEGSELGEEEEEDSELGEEGSELGEEEQTSGEEEEREEHSEIAKEEEASVLHETQGSTFQGLTVVKEQGVEKITRSGEEIGLISLVVDSDSEEGNVKTPSQTKTKETFHGLRELAFSYLVWDSKEKKLVKCQEGGAAAMTSQGIGTPCLTLYLASPSESLEAGSDGANSRSRMVGSTESHGVGIRAADPSGVKRIRQEFITLGQFLDALLTWALVVDRVPTFPALSRYLDQWLLGLLFRVVRV